MIVIPHNIPQSIREGTKHIVRYLQLYRGVPTIITWGTFSYSCWTNIVNWCWTIIDFYCSCIIITLCFFLFKVLKCFQLDDTTLWIVVTQVCSHIVSLSPSLSLACYTCCFYIRLQISCISFNFWKSDHCSYVLSHVTMSLQTVFNTREVFTCWQVSSVFILLYSQQQRYMFRGCYGIHSIISFKPLLQLFLCSLKRKMVS